MNQEIDHAISACAAITAIIMAIVAMILTEKARRLDRRISDKAEEAIRLASLAIERVSSSRKSRLEEAEKARSESLFAIHADPALYRPESGSDFHSSSEARTISSPNLSNSLK